MVQECTAMQAASPLSLGRVQEAKHHLRAAFDTLVCEYAITLIANPTAIMNSTLVRLDTLLPWEEPVPEEHWAACVHQMRLTQQQVCRGGALLLGCCERATCVGVLPLGTGR